GFRRGGIDFLEDLFQRIHEAVIYNARHYDECRGMGATLTLLWETPDKVFYGHVGDSRLYYLPVDGGILQVSEDHTHVGWLLRTGEIAAIHARMHPGKNQLQQTLGGRGGSVDPQFGTLKLDPGDTLMLCTDGVSHEISQRVIESSVRDA